MANRVARRPAFRAAKRPTSWTRSVAVAHTTVAAATKVLIGTLTLDNPGIGVTVRRTRGQVMVLSDTTAAIENQTGAFGMVVATDLALAAGVASLPGPVTNASDDGWFVWVPFFNRGSSNTSSFLSFNVPFDSKAMRRVVPGYGIGLVVENASAAQGFNFGCVFALLNMIR